MSAVFTGNGLGLFNTSLSQLGAGLGGGAGIGQGHDAQYVNVATGNLVWQSQDEHLTFRGLAIGLTRTYNSRGTSFDVGLDGWVTGFERKVSLQSGTFNAAGSVMRRTTGDGSYQDFIRIGTNSYRSTGSDGAHDTLTWLGNSWRYVEGSTRREEDYANHADGFAQGRLTHLRGPRSDLMTQTTWEVVYSATRIAELRANDGTGMGDALIFSYDGGNRLSSVSTREAGTVRLQISYGYDGQGRLTSVLTDLTPGNTDDNAWNATTPSNNDGRLFRTEYTYEGTSLRLASVRQSDGTLVSYTYHADGRLKTVTRGDINTDDADGAGETVTYTYGFGNTTVTDSLGRAWVYEFHVDGMLTSITAPAISGQSDITTYQYNFHGKVTQAKTVRGATVLSLVDYAYDAQGNLIWEWDGLGSAISRTWSERNQLLSLTRYTGLDPDRHGLTLPTGGMTTYYIYDNRDRLRFVVDARGQVSEFGYATSGNGIGQQSSARQYLGASYVGSYDMASLQAWAVAEQKANSQLSELAYDAWGRLSQRTDYAAVDASGAGVLDTSTGITRYTYDAQGTLRQQVTVRGAFRTLNGAAEIGSEQVDYVYDGMGRLLSVTKRQVGAPDLDSTTMHTSYTYLDSGYQVAVTDDAGQVTVQTRDAAGRLVSVSAQGLVDGNLQTRTQLKYYDGAGQLRASEDAGGGRTYYFYDAKGRLAATVDPTGAVSRITYDGADRILSTRQYADRVTTTNWVVGGEVVPTTVTTTDNNTLDRVTGRTYDAAGRLATETDGLASNTSRTITTYTYDAAGRVLQMRTTDAAGTTSTARVLRYFYDEAGRQVGQLDAAGYLTETQYDRAGRVAAQIRYATVSPSVHWASGSLEQLRPSTNAAQDQTTRYYYDGLGRQVGMLDAQGYLTEWVFDEAGNARAERRYATALTWSGSDTLASLRSRAGAYREQRMAYNALGQLVTQTNAEGTVTSYTYDEAGRLAKTEVAQGASEVREGHRRYNVFGELIGELSGESALQLLPGMTESQLDAVYAQSGVRHGYDALGRRIESIDAAGNRTWYFYDAAGRNTFTVRGVADGNGVANAQGEVTETRYTAFGDASDQIAYTGRITLAVPGSRDSAQAAVSVLVYSSTVDTRRQFTYTARGQLATTIDAVNAQTRYTYDAFGQLQQQVQAYGTAVAVTLQYEYDARGLRTRLIEEVDTAVQRERTQTYDAFGRVTSTTDARGAVQTFSYDRLGRQLTAVQVVQGRTEQSTTTYDAYDRRVSVTDAEGQVTTYVHNDGARSLTVTSPEGVVITTLHNRHGQTVQVNDAAGRTEYSYDRNGSLTRTERKAGDGTVVTAEAREYDTGRGLLTAVVDGSGRRVEYQYDAAGRVLRRIQDPAGMALVTAYAYDGQGRQLSVTDPSGRLVSYQYDREGRLTQTAQDPASLNLRTQYTYDLLGRQVTLVEGAGTAVSRTTQYNYDVLGRRTSEVIDPGAGKLNLTTSYAYDKNDNLIRRTDANGQVTRYYYDEANRLTHSVDPLGAMTRRWYDRVGQLVAVRSLNELTNPATLTDSDSIAQLDARLVWTEPHRGEYRVYDKDGRIRFVLNSGGALVEHRYDAAGRLVFTRAYANSYSPGGLVPALFDGTADPSQILPEADDARDERTYYVRDAAGQLRLTVDALGNVRQLQYDAAGRVVGSIAYAQPAALTTPLRNQLQAGTATVAGVLASVTASPSKDMVEHRIHDAAGRLRYTIDAIGAVRETLYDASGLEIGTRAYAMPIAVDAMLRSRLQAGTATIGEIEGLLTPAIVNDVRNLEQFQVYDDAGRMRFTLQVLRDASGNATGMLGELRYDQAGRVIERLDRETSVTTVELNAQLVALRAGTVGLSTVSSWMTGNTRYTAWVHDAAGRTRYTLQADTTTTRTVLEQRYDAAGQVVAEVAYAVTIPLSTARTMAAVAAAITTAGGDAATQQRVTAFVRDAAGQLRFRMDDAGAVTELRYDGLGRVVQTRQYAQLVSTATATTEAAMAAAVAGQSGSNVRVTQTTYDSVGRIASVTDAAGHIESYGYDSISRRTSLTNKLGQVWTYAYDAAGRLVEETSPQVTVASSTTAGNVTTVTRSVKTVTAYDALGNVISRTEDATGAQPRTTQYEYDSRGLQVRTIFPDAWQVDGSGQLVATGQAPTIEVTYDALGQAVVQKDVRDHYSYKVYNSLGQVAYEVDATGNVSAYTYNGYGDQATLRRHAAKLSTGAIPGFVAGNALTLSQMTASAVLVDATNDRVLTTTYDRRGLKSQITQSTITYVKADGSTAAATPTTQFTYNAFGELARTSVLLDASTSLWAHSWQYYDELGRVTLGVDAEGYVTQTQYNALGQAVQVKEYARALSTAAQAALTTQAPPAPPTTGDAATGYDRVVNYGYDAMGRKASESVLRHYGRADGSQGIRPVTTQWTYDAAGQVTVTDVDGQQTRTAYDALGRVVAVQEAAQQRLAITAESQLLGTTNIGLGTQSLYVQVSAYTALAYDAFGNAVRTIRYANGLVEGQGGPVADAANDQVSIVAYDRQGRAVMNQDAQGNKVYLRYDAADNIVHSWYELSAGSGANKTVHSYYTYDAAGRQLTSRIERDGGGTVLDQFEVVQYNAFGEIVAKGNDLSLLPAQYQYDRAGNLVRSNAEGAAWRDYGYNLAGHQVRESHSVYVGPGNVTAVTRYITDRLGRTVAMVLPSHTQTATPVNHLSQKVDRWGNVIELVDPRGYQTNYQYNDRNQLVREIRPQVNVVTEAAPDGIWQRPEFTWSYDELGRLVASRDGNGNTTRYEYDGAGKQVKVIDANGSVTLTAYDALGRARITQNALGYLTWKQYDRLDQVTAHGDYLPSSSGSTRTNKTLESYVLNQNGQRVQVSNALGQTHRYDYDSRGLLVKSRTPTGVEMVYEYDLGGRRSLERYALSQASLGDRDGEMVKTNEQTWDYDYFGRLIDRNDLSGNDYDYTYDAASGLLKTETNSRGLSRTILYTANGLVREIQEPNGVVYRYEYDQAGNRTMEYAKVKDSRGKQYEVRTEIVYDSHHRIQRVTQDEVVGNKRVFELTYDYDAAGNRTRVKAQTGYGENTAPIDTTNAPPEVIGQPANRAIRSGVATEFRLRLSDLFRDPEGKPLTVTAVQFVGGTETSLPSWLSYSVNAGTGEAVFLASTGSSVADGQTLTLRLKASDGSGTASVDFALSVRANTAPVEKAGAKTDYTIKTGHSWSLELAAADYFLDEDVGDSLALTATVSPSAGWLTIDAGNPSVLRLNAATPVVGTYTLTLTATDQLGATKTRTVTLTVVANSAPEVVASIPEQNAVIGRNFVLEKSLAEVFVDSHDDSMTVAATLLDGSALPNWLVFSYIPGSPSPQLRLAGPVPIGIADGTVLQIKLTATDSDGASNSTAFNITLRNNRAPEVVSTPSVQQMDIGQAWSVQLPATLLFRDPEGDALSFELLHPDGTTKTGWAVLSVNSATGMLTLSGTPTSELDHIGTHLIQIRARDIDGLTQTVNITLKVNGHTAPERNTSVAMHDQQIQIGRPFSFTLPENLFTDADGDPLSLLLMQAEEQWQELDTIPPQITYWVVTSPLPGWMNYNAETRTVSGTVPPGESVRNLIIRAYAYDGSQYSFDYDRTGVAGNPYDGDFIVSIVPYANRAPIYNAGTLPNRTAVHGDAVNYPLPAGAFTEPDGDTLTYSAQVLVGGDWVSLSHIGLSINSSTGAITGTATNLTQASYTIQVVASDPSGESDPGSVGTFVLSVTNTPPTVGILPSQSMTRGQESSFGVASYFGDVNQNVLSFAATGLPAGLSINAGTGVISGTPTATLGDYTVTVTASDGWGGSVGASFTLTIGGAAPSAPMIPNRTAPAATSWSYTVPAFTDPNNETLTYTVSGMPAWMSFNAGTRTLSGTPGPVGSWTITITATNPSNLSASTAFSISTPNEAPKLAHGISNRSTGRNQSWTFQIPSNTFNDPNGDTLAYSVGALPAGITFNATTRTFSGTPSVLGYHTITVTVTDGNGGSSSTNFVLEVKNSAPQHQYGIGDKDGQRGQAVSWPMPAGAFIDPNGDPLTYSLWVLRPAYNQYYEIYPGVVDVRWVPEEWFPAATYNFAINSSTGTITGTPYPMPLPSGTSLMQGEIINDYTLKIVASDGDATAEAWFNLHVNEAPTGYVGNQTIKSGLAWSFQIPAFSDPNNDPLSYSVSGLPAGLSFNSSNRTISGSVAAAGNYTVTVTASDGRGGSTAVAFTLTVQANNAPTASGVPNLNGTVGSALSYSLPEFSDPNYDTLSYSVTGLPPGMWFDVGGRALGGTPSEAGTWQVTYTANDGRGGTASTQFSITINAVPPPNQAPYVNIAQGGHWHHFYSTDMWLVPPESFTLPVNAFVDPDNNPMTYAILQKPSWLSYNFVAGVGHVFSGVNNDPSPYKTHTIQLRATDAGGLSSGVLTIYVTSTFESGGGGDPMSQPMEPMQEFSMGEIGEVPPVAQSMSGPAANVQEHWFAYDKLNRLTVFSGALQNGQVVVAQVGGSQSYGIQYDAVGNEVARTQWRGDGSSWWTTVAQQTYSLRGELLLTFGEARLGEPAVPVEKRTYDDAGRLTQVLGYFGPTQYVWVNNGDDTEYTVDVTGWLKSAETRSYDADGRLTSVVTRTRSDQWITRNPTGMREYNFPVWVDGIQGGGGGDQSTDLGLLTMTSTVSYEGAGKGYDAAGRLVGYSYTGQGYTHTYTYTYEGWDSYREKTVAGSSVGNSNYKPTISTMTYDVGGRQIEIREHTDGVALDDRVRTFAFDGNGMILSRRDGTVTSGNVFQQNDAQGQAATGWVLGSMNHHFVHANGQQVASLNEAGYQEVLSRMTAFSNSEAGKAQVVVQAGEDLRGVAQRVYGDANLWYVIAAANGLEGEGVLVAGTSLTVPEVKTSSNDANTFKPYNPGEITGPTSPGLPYIASPDKGCNVVQQIIMVVVIAVVSYYTFGAVSGAMMTAAETGGATLLASTATVTTAAGVTTTTASLTALGTMTAGAVTAATGAAAGMAVGSVMGVASFSWRDVAQAGVSSFLTAGLASTGVMRGAMSLAGNSQFARSAISAAAGQLTSYAASQVAGLDVSFSWKRIAVSAVSAGTTGAAMPKVGPMLGIDLATQRGQFAADMVGGVIGGTVAMHASRAMGLGGEVNYGRVLSDAFGNTLGNSVSGRHAAWADEFSKVQGSMMAQGGSLQTAATLREEWAIQDAADRQRMIDLEVWGFDSADPWLGAQGEVAGLPSDVRTLDDIVLASNADPRAATRTVYHTRHVDPYLIERNGGGADQWNVVSTYGIKDTPAVLIEGLAADTIARPVQPISWTEVRNASLESMKNDARNSWGGNIFMRGAASAGYGVIQGGNNLLGIFIDPVYGRKIEAGITYAATHPKEVGAAVVTGAKQWWQMPLADKVEGVTALGLETLATAGTGLVTRTSHTAHMLSEAAELAARQTPKMISDVADPAGDALVGGGKVVNTPLAAESAGMRGLGNAYAANGELVQSIATRADNWGIRQGLGIGPVAGTLKHGYAEVLLNRYQRMFGDRGLSAEVRYVNGAPWRPGDPIFGSIKLDVVEGPLTSPTYVWDYKFGNATLPKSQITRIQSGIPNGASVPVTMVKP